LQRLLLVLGFGGIRIDRALGTQKDPLISPIKSAAM